MTRILTFDTTHHALLAEQIAHEYGFAAEVTNAPAESKAKCDLALEVLPEEADGLMELLTREGVVFALWR